MAEKNATEKVIQALEELRTRLDGVESLAVLRRDGTVLHNVSPDTAPKSFMAISSKFIELAHRLCRTLQQGETTETMVKGQKRFFALYQTPESDVFLAILGKATVNLGLVSSGCRLAIERIHTALHE